MFSPREFSQWTPLGLEIRHICPRKPWWSPSFEGLVFLARLWHAQPWRDNALYCAGYKAGAWQVCVGLYWMVASQLQNSSHHLVTHVFPTFEIVGLVTLGYVSPVLSWSLTGSSSGPWSAANQAAPADRTQKPPALTPMAHNRWKARVLSRLTPKQDSFGLYLNLPIPGT